MARTSALRDTTISWLLRLLRTALVAVRVANARVDLALAILRQVGVQLAVEPVRRLRLSRGEEICPVQRARFKRLVLILEASDDGAIHKLADHVSRVSQLVDKHARDGARLSRHDIRR